MLDSLRHVRLDIRTGTRWLTALATLTLFASGVTPEKLYWFVFVYAKTVMSLRSFQKSDA